MKNIKHKKIWAAVLVIVLVASSFFIYYRVKDKKNAEFVDTDMDGIADKDDDTPDVWNVGDRDLAIFSRLSFRNGSAYVGKMFPASLRLGDKDSPSYALYKTDPGIFDKWILEDFTEETIYGASFSAMTFVNGDNVVIVYRGTDDLGDWVWNIAGISLLDYHIEEKAAIDYAVDVAKKHPNSKIYITGHSLGGYLAQIAGAELLKIGNKNLQEIVYFNGIGLDYNTSATYSKKEEKKLLSDFSKNHRLVCYEIKGDVVSAIGKHSGEELLFDACDILVQKYYDSEVGNLWVGASGLLAILSLNKILGSKFVDYYMGYKAKSLEAYLNITHDMDNFIQIIEQGNRKNPR